MNKLLLIAVALVVLTAGCFTSSETPSTSKPTESVDQSSPLTATPLPEVTTENDSRTEVQTPTPVPISNPWGHEPVTIGITNYADPERDYTEPVQRAVTYWNTTGAEFTSWNPYFVLRPNSTQTDLVVRFVDGIDECGPRSTNETVGCAPVLDATDEAARTETVQIQLGLTESSVFRLVLHELGHVLGLEHGEGPGDVMAPRDTLFREVYRVHIEYATDSEFFNDKSRRQVRHALNYYADGGGGIVDEDIGFAIVEDRSQADIVIEFTNEDGVDDGSIANSSHSQFVITVDGIDRENRGWHVGYWLGFYFGADEIAELPEPFDEPEEDLREGWWQRY